MLDNIPHCGAICRSIRNPEVNARQARVHAAEVWQSKRKQKESRESAFAERRSGLLWQTKEARDGVETKSIGCSSESVITGMVCAVCSSRGAGCERIHSGSHL